MAGADYLADVVQMLNRWKQLGSRELANGTRLIGHVPHVGPLAYLHTIFGALDQNQILKIEVQIERKLHKDLIEFYKVWNGCVLFVGVLHISGLRLNYDRSLEYASRQPFSIRTPNIEERPKNADPSWVFFGGYNWDGSKLCINESGSISLVSSDDASVVKYRWSNLANMLTSEVRRISALFDDQGHRLNKAISTLPPLAGAAGSA